MTRVARTTRRRTRPRPGRSLPNRAASTRAAPEPGSEPNAGSRTALQKHVDFFDSNQDGLITFSETYDGLRRLGIDVVRSAAFAAIINGVLGPMTSRTLTLTIDTPASSEPGIKATPGSTTNTDISHFLASARFSNVATQTAPARWVLRNCRVSSQETARIWRATSARRPSSACCSKSRVRRGRDEGS